MAQKILIVDDEEDIRELISFNLSAIGFQTIEAENGKDAIKLAQSSNVDLILLDLMLPIIDGLEVCRILKKDNKTANIPIIMLTAKSEESDVLIGLELGADDYITKPFSPKILIARIRTILRRTTNSQNNNFITFLDIEMNVENYETIVSGKNIVLTHTEFEILKMLISNPGRVFTRDTIINNVKGDDYPVTFRSVDVHILNLRKKLGKIGEKIETIRGVGYKIKE